MRNKSNNTTMATIQERAERFASNFPRCEQSLARECYIRGSYDQKEIDDKEAEQIKDELDVLQMQYLSQVSLWKSRYKEMLDKSCEWIKNNACVGLMDEEVDDFIEDFRKAMIE